MKKCLIVTHHDLDGWMSAVAVESNIRVEDMSVEVVWSPDPSEAKTDELLKSTNWDVAYVLDRAIPAGYENREIYHYDHHIGSEKSYSGVHSHAHAACKLIADDLGLAENIKELCNAASLWDTFQWKQAPADKADAAIRLNKLKLTYETYEEFRDAVIDADLKEFVYGTKNSLLLEILDREEEKYIKSKMKTIKIVDFRGAKVGFFTWEKLVSQISDKFLTENENIDIIIGYNAEYDSVSFRSKVTDVASIAKEFNGGGHKNAAGCSAIGEIANFVKSHILNR